MTFSDIASDSSRFHTSPDAGLRVSLPPSDGRAPLRVTDSVLIGRDASCDVRFDDHRISRRHAEIYRVGSLWWVRDVDSVDGTYLEDECIDAVPVMGIARLKLGVGGPTLRLEPEGDSLTLVH